MTAIQENVAVAQPAIGRQHENQATANQILAALTGATATDAAATSRPGRLRVD